jgi:hypothetical protein
MTNSDTALPETFDPETEEGTHFDVIPIGPYVAQITEASVCQPNSNDGYYVALRWQITEGAHENRLVFQNITLQHSNTQAVVIGRRQFKDLCVATGISEQVTDLEVFKFIRCRIRVGIEKDKKQGIYPDKNKVSRILPLEDPKGATPAEAAPKTGPTARPAAAAAQPTTGIDPAPWRETAKPPSTGEAINDEVPF